MSILTGSINNNNCVLPIVDLISNENEKAKITAHNLFYSNNTTVGSLSSYDNYFGTGADGSVTISSSVQISSSTSPAGLNNISREFGDTIVKNYQNLTINSGVLFSPLRACRGMVIYCTGNLTVNGTISMTGKGGGVATKIAAPIGIASSTDSRYDLVDATLYFNNFSSSTAGGYGIPTHWNWAPSGSIWFSNYKIRVPLSGSVAGGSGISAAGPAGIFCCGGGGAGGSGGGAAAGSGGRGTIFSGGAGGGAGGNPVIGNQGGAGSFDAGGNGVSAVPAPFNGIGGGGAGSPAGLGGPGGTPTSNGTPGTGGLLILIVRGNITINGTISNNGRVGGNGSITPGQPAAGGGGGSGGGRTIIIYGGTYTNAGSVVVNGGSGGAAAGPGGTAGGAGGAGAITVRRVHV
jgi:hypothetical protein